MINRNTLLILAAALAAGLGFYAAQRYAGFPREPVHPQQDVQASVPTHNPLASRMQTAHLFDTPRVLPPFRLTAADGSMITNASLQGRWSLVFLGFTRCPDVCPTTLQDLAMAQKAWADLPAAVVPRILFVSVDPEHDTPQKVGAYTRFFSPDIQAATADLPMLEAFARSLGMVFMKVPTTGGDYDIDHSASVSLIDPQGRMAGLIQPPLESAKIGADLRVLATSR
jgi:protein SCO1/2